MLIVSVGLCRLGDTDPQREKEQPRNKGSVSNGHERVKRHNKIPSSSLKIENRKKKKKRKKIENRKLLNV